MKRRLHGRYLAMICGLVVLAVLAFQMLEARSASAYGNYLDSFNLQYGTTGTALNTCNLCHPGGNTKSLNGYATAYRTAGYNFTAIQNADSDGDGFSNIAEINARTFPGDAASKPAAPTNTPVPPANTPTRTSTPVPPTNTATRVPTNTPTTVPGQPTNTPTRTNTPAPPTNTPLPTNTPAVPPTNTPTRAVTNTATPAAGSPTPSRTTTAIPAPPARRALFVGTVTSLPSAANRIGTWRVDNHVVRVSAATLIAHRDRLRSGSRVWVTGSRRTDGSVDATYISVLTSGGGSGED